LLTRTLEQAGYQVYTASNGSEAIIRAHAIHPMAITLDLQMPESDGWGVLQTLQHDTVLREIPVIVISVLDAKAESLSKGASDYLAKPLQRAKLLAVVERIRDTVH
jgi:CheY-like chemotaxis protein